MYFYLDDGQISHIKQDFLTNYLKHKVEGYKQQDKKAGRNIKSSSYITTEWCFERLCGNCQKCGKQFDIDINSGCISTDFTAQRKDNVSKQEIIANIYYDKSGFGSKKTTLEDAKKEG